jgi:hypothetical protein
VRPFPAKWQITIPTKVTVTNHDLHASGEFSIDRADFKIKATSAVHGVVRVQEKIKFTFDIVGHQFWGNSLHLLNSHGLNYQTSGISL